MASTIPPCGFETLDTSQALATSGTFSVVSTPTAGVWSIGALEINPASGVAGSVRLSGCNSTGNPVGTNNIGTTVYVRFRFRIDSLPTSGNTSDFFEVIDTSGNEKLVLRVSSAGTITARTQPDAGGTLIATGTAGILSTTGVWYCIQLKVGTGATAAAEWYVDGVQDASTTFNNASNVAAGSVLCGRTANTITPSAVDFYFDDVTCSDSAYPDQYGRVSMLVPTANGTYQTWSIGAGSGSHYQVVDEFPPNGNTDYLLSDNVSGDAETEIVTDGNSCGIGGTINCVSSYINIARNVTTNGSAKMRLHSASTDNDTSAAATVNAYVGKQKLYTTDPATSAAWLSTALTAIEVGAVENSTTNKSRLSAVAAMVDWTPACVGSGATKTLIAGVI